MMDLSTILDVLLTAIALVLLIPIGLLLLEVLSALRVPNAPVPGTTRPRVAIVMPAHNEASGISRSLGSILPQLTAADRLIVVADNCSDDTSTVASRTGAEVIVRNDAERRGKGYALDFGVRHLEKTNPPDVVIIIDADCRVADGTIDRIARLSHHTGRPVQSLYLMHAPVGSSVKVRIAEFAWIVKNRVRPSGLLRLGLPCQLMGTGMAFPWECIRTAPLATGHIVEDLKLGIDLALAGTPPLFCREALVSSDFPTFAEGVQSQRTRWEHGHLSVIVSEAPKMLLHSLRRWDGRALALALDLTIPPVALLTLLTLGVWSVSVIFFAWTRVQRPLVLGSIDALMLVGTLMLSWWRYGRDVISLRDMVSAVRYLIWKIPLYGRFLLARQVSWVRSKREHDSDDHPKENRP